MKDTAKPATKKARVRYAGIDGRDVRPDQPGQLTAAEYRPFRKLAAAVFARRPGAVRISLSAFCDRRGDGYQTVSIMATERVDGVERATHERYGEPGVKD